MPTPLPSPRQLSYLLALHEHQHFGRAAAACFVTQSTLSVGIAELERLLGAQLVERSKRSVRFTDVGEEVTARARGILRSTEDLCAAAQGAREPLVGTLRLAVIPTIAPFLLPAMMIGVSAAWPRLRLSVREMLTGPACEALQRGTMDCVLLALPFDCGAIDTAPICVDRLLLATRATGPQDASSVSPEEIDADRLLLLEDGHCLKEHALAACALSSRPPDAPVLAATLHTLVRLVDAGLGTTLLPEMAIGAGILLGTDVQSRPIDGLEAERRIVLAWRRGNPRADDLGRLAGTMRAAIAPS